MRAAAACLSTLALLLAGAAAAQAPQPVTATALTPAALTLRSAVQPRFPLSLRGTAHSDGYAIVALTIDAEGHVDDAVALEASHPAFGTEAQTAVARWLFEPAPASTRPPRDVVQFEFRSAGVVNTLTHAEAAARTMAEAPLQPQLRTVRWNEMASPPQTLVATAPALRAKALARLADRPVIVSFVIDTQGAVHVPVVDADTDEEVAGAVLSAMRTWRFTPPRHGEEPVLVQAYRAFGGAEERR